MEKIIAGSTL